VRGEKEGGSFNNKRRKSGLDRERINSGMTEWKKGRLLQPRGKKEKRDKKLPDGGEEEKTGSATGLEQEGH